MKATVRGGLWGLGFSVLGLALGFLWIGGGDGVYLMFVLVASPLWFGVFIWPAVGYLFGLGFRWSIGFAWLLVFVNVLSVVFSINPASDDYSVSDLQRMWRLAPMFSIFTFLVVASWWAYMIRVSFPSGTHPHPCQEKQS